MRLNEPGKTAAKQAWQFVRIRPGAYNGTAHRPSPTELFGISRKNPNFRVGDGLCAVPLYAPRRIRTIYQISLAAVYRVIETQLLTNLVPIVGRRVVRCRNVSHSETGTIKRISRLNPTRYTPVTPLSALFSPVFSLAERKDRAAGGIPSLHPPPVFHPSGGSPCEFSKSF